MKRLRLLALYAALALATTAPSCRLFRRSKNVPPPPPPPPPAETTPSKPQQATLPAPPPIGPNEPDLAKPAPAPSEKLPPAPRTGHARRKPPEAPPAQPAPTPEAQTQQPPPAPAATSQLPEIQQILTPEQRQEYIEAIDQNIVRAQHTIEALHSRKLTREQRTALQRIRAFLDQANDARRTDLFRAKNLSERASVLAEDLLRSMQ